MCKYNEVGIRAKTVLCQEVTSENEHKWKAVKKIYVIDVRKSESY